MLKFSPANTKLKKLYSTPQLAGYLTNKRKIYSLDLQAGHTCPYAKDCLSKAVVQTDGRLKIVDGPHTKFRCYAASQEAQYTGVHKLRKHNTDLLRQHRTTAAMIGEIRKAMPKNAGVVRIHSSGDFYSQTYFNAWVQVARQYPKTLFYAYTKALPFWVKRIELGRMGLPMNLVLTASRGGTHDKLIDKHGLREVTVVYSEQEADDLGLSLDQNDLSAANPATRGVDFALLLHGSQPAKSEASIALQKIKVGQRKS